MPLHVAAVIVVAELRRADAEAGEHDRARRACPLRAEAVRIELLADAQLRAAGAVAAGDLERVDRRVAERRRHQVVRLEEELPLAPASAPCARTASG